ncbi:helix-turn-helix domain-containing protein [Nonomuraea sp. NPDC048916]|uniref:helix-turn-helix domain-containing protein n=1 Tax=Nonomuraea sp. NPDC048916 TaxID=3154232 RepID=UPI00340EFF6B
MSDTWTIGELAERAADVLRGDAQPVNGRVRDVPGERLIRWYTTIGLVDPPLSRRGRIARYGRRHLLQLVAVKRLQAAGRSIADIQTALAGATDSMLEAAAQPLDDAPVPAPETAGLDTGAARARFWTRPPDSAHGPGDTRAPGDVHETAGPDGRGGARDSDVPFGPDNAHDSGAPRGPDDAHRADGVRTSGDGARRTEVAAGARAGPERDATDGTRLTAGGLVRGVRLATGVTLVLDDAGRTPTSDDIKAVLTAAGPLLAALEERKLL